MVAHTPDTVHGNVQVEITAMAHGGEGIARVNDKVVFVEGGLPGDVGELQIHTDKKRFARGILQNRSVDSPMRAHQRCEAAAQGAGCCDYGEVDPTAELPLKAHILKEQLARIGKLDAIPNVEEDGFGLPTHWRTRVRVGADEQGRPGFRAKHSRALVVDVPCAQMTPKLQAAVFDGQRFTPHVQVVAVEDATGKVHVAEVAAASRGKRSEKLLQVLQGSRHIVESILFEGEAVQFTLPITGFWQAHTGATQHYAEIMRQWISDASANVSVSADTPVVAWDLYGGVGAFIPAIAAGATAIAQRHGAAGISVHSVESSSEATAAGRDSFEGLEHPMLQAATVKFHTGLVHKVIAQLPDPTVVVLDPPRSGAGTETIAAIAQRRPQAVVHIGCDPATMARDLQEWQQHGYQLTRLQVVNAFPGTHHSETLALLAYPAADSLS